MLKVLERRKRQGKRVVALEERPRIFPDLQPVYATFQVLSSRRFTTPYKFQDNKKVYLKTRYQAIQVSEIIAVWNAFHRDGYYTIEEFTALVLHLDTLWMRKHADA